MFDITKRRIANLLKPIPTIGACLFLSGHERQDANIFKPEIACKAVVPEDPSKIESQRLLITKEPAFMSKEERDKASKLFEDAIRSHTNRFFGKTFTEDVNGKLIEIPGPPLYELKGAEKSLIDSILEDLKSTKEIIQIRALADIKVAGEAIILKAISYKLVHSLKIDEKNVSYDGASTFKISEHSSYQAFTIDSTLNFASLILKNGQKIVINNKELVSDDDTFALLEVPNTLNQFKLSDILPNNFVNLELTRLHKKYLKFSHIDGIKREFLIYDGKKFDIVPKFSESDQSTYKNVKKATDAIEYLKAIRNLEIFRNMADLQIRLLETVDHELSRRAVHGSSGVLMARAGKNVGLLKNFSADPNVIGKYDPSRIQIIEDLASVSSDLANFETDLVKNNKDALYPPPLLLESASDKKRLLVSLGHSLCIGELNDAGDIVYFEVQYADKKCGAKSLEQMLLKWDIYDSVTCIKALGIHNLVFKIANDSNAEKDLRTNALLVSTSLFEENPIKSLGHFVKEDRVVVELIAEKLKSDPSYSWSLALASFGSKAVPVIRNLLGDSKPEVKMLAYDALLATRCPEATIVLEELANNSKDTQLRINAKAYLIDIGKNVKNEDVSELLKVVSNLNGREVYRFNRCFLQLLQHNKINTPELAYKSLLETTKENEHFAIIQQLLRQHKSWAYELFFDYLLKYKDLSDEVKTNYLNVFQLDEKENTASLVHKMSLVFISSFEVSTVKSLLRMEQILCNVRANNEKIFNESLKITEKYSVDRNHKLLKVYVFSSKNFNVWRFSRIIASPEFILLDKVVDTHSQTPIDTKKPLAVIFAPRSDYNGAFSSIGTLAKQISDAGYEIRYYEVGKEEELKKALSYEYKNTDGKVIKPHLIVFSGHGSQEGMELGFRDHKNPDKEKFTVTSINTFIDAGLSSSLAENGQVILNSCSTGEGGKDSPNLVNKLRELFPQAKKLGIHGPKRPAWGQLKIKFDGIEIKEIEWGNVGVPVDDYQSKGKRLGEPFSSLLQT